MKGERVELQVLYRATTEALDAARFPSFMCDVAGLIDEPGAVAWRIFILLAD